MYGSDLSTLEGLWCNTATLAVHKAHTTQGYIPADSGIDCSLCLPCITAYCTEQIIRCRHAVSQDMTCQKTCIISHCCVSCIGLVIYVPPAMSGFLWPCVHFCTTVVYTGSLGTEQMDSQQ